MLLAMVLAGLTLLRDQREWSAGALFAGAAALKAFPVAIFPYLIWRRRWRAALSGWSPACVGVFLLLVPAPFRGFERNLTEVKTWDNAMVFSANEKGFGQRQQQNWGWKNNSLIAVVHRYVRPINAEAEHPEYKPIYVNLLNLTYYQANIVLAEVAGYQSSLDFIALLPRASGGARRLPGGAGCALLVALMTMFLAAMAAPTTVSSRACCSRIQPLLVHRAALEPEQVVRR